MRLGAIALALALALSVSSGADAQPATELDWVPEPTYAFPLTYVGDLRTVSISIENNTPGGIAAFAPPTLSDNTDFWISANSCVSGLAYLHTCAIVVVFQPQGVPYFSTTLSMAYNATSGSDPAPAAGVQSIRFLGAAELPPTPTPTITATPTATASSTGATATPTPSASSTAATPTPSASSTAATPTISATPSATMTPCAVCRCVQPAPIWTNIPPWPATPSPEPAPTPDPLQEWYDQQSQGMQPSP